LPWEIDTSDLQKHFNTEKVRLINDLEATAYGMINLDENDFVDLNPDAKRVDANRAVIAAGTGLGEAILFYDGVQYHPMASEGGHCDFAPLTQQQDLLLNWMRERYPEHVSYERVLSGPGIHMLYEFLLDIGYEAAPDCMKKIVQSKDPSAMVSRCALKDKDPLCLEALNLFAEIYGAEAGNLALKSMSTGGVYIGGGIAPKILEVLREDQFMNGFVRKGRFEKMLRKIPVRLSMHTDTALLGAAYFALDRLD
jgi:glucokinase